MATLARRCNTLLRSRPRPAAQSGPDKAIQTTAVRSKVHSATQLEPPMIWTQMSAAQEAMSAKHTLALGRELLPTQQRARATLAPWTKYVLRETAV